MPRRSCCRVRAGTRPDRGSPALGADVGAVRPRRARLRPSARGGHDSRAVTPRQRRARRARGLLQLAHQRLPLARRARPGTRGRPARPAAVSAEPRHPPHGVAGAGGPRARAGSERAPRRDQCAPARPDPPAGPGDARDRARSRGPRRQRRRARRAGPLARLACEPARAGASGGSPAVRTGPDLLRGRTRGLRPRDCRRPGPRAPAQRAVRGAARRAGRAARRPRGGRPLRPATGRSRATPRPWTSHLLARVHRGALGRARHGRGPARAGPRRGIRVPGSVSQCARGAQLRGAAPIPPVPRAAASQGMSPRLRVLAVGVLTLSLATRPLGSQGITSAALQRSIVQLDGTPIHGAVVTATLAASGERWRVAADAAGRYFVENVQVGGPYLIEVRAVGFKPVGQHGVLLDLGQRYRVDFVLEPSVVELPPLAVSASGNQLLNAGRTGPGHIVSESELARLPNLARDLSVAAALDPLAVLRPLGGIAIGGQNQGYNSLQVDGGVNADLYLGRTPGGASPSAALPEVLPHTISLETVREFQVLAAPFDVRLGSFAGGLLNAVTKSGTNAFHGSAFGFLQDGSLTAQDAAGNRSDFTTWQFGGTLSGPIVRDRVHFFLNADLQQRVVPDARFLVTADTVGGADLRKTGISYASAVRFQQILRDSFGLQPGSVGPSDGHLPAQDIFAKITVQLGASGHLELSQHYAHGDRREFVDTGRTYGSYALSSVAGRSSSTAETWRLIWSALVGGRAQNELILSYEHLRDSCRPNAAFPLVQVAADSGTLIAGPNSVCPTTAVDQNALEITENLTIGAGRHLLTIGSHGELFHFRDPLVQVSAGRWLFSSLDLLARGLANHYDRGLGSSARPPGADFRVFGLGLYAQDRWAPTSRLTLTGGLRLDVPFLLDAAMTNQRLVASALGTDTGRLPSGNVLWSPRLGVNYDLSGDGDAFLRGGIGLFGGPPPYRWLGNGYRETGDETVVFCNRPDVPPFDPLNQPETCPSGGGTSPRISFFDPGLKLPQNLKLALGVDRRFPSGVVATIDFLYTRAVHQIYESDANLGAPTSAAAGEGGRPLYGTISGTTSATLVTNPAWRDTSFGEKEIYRVSNRGGDHGFSLSTQLRKRFGERLQLYASYAYSRAQDRMSWVNFPARANF